MISSWGIQPSVTYSPKGRGSAGGYDLGQRGWNVSQEYMISCDTVPYGFNCFQNLLSVPVHLGVAIETSLFSPAFSLTRWPIQEGLDPDSVLSTLFTSFLFLCLVGAGQFHLLHVSVSVLLVCSVKHVYLNVSLSFLRFLSVPCIVWSMPSLLTLWGIVEWSLLLDSFS